MLHFNTGVIKKIAAMLLFQQNERLITKSETLQN